MVAEALELIVKNEPRISTRLTGGGIDQYVRGTIALYTAMPIPQPLFIDQPTIIDMPSIQCQVHLHENELGISGGRLYSYDREAFRPINAYEGAMLDLQAQQLNLPRY